MGNNPYYDDERGEDFSPPSPEIPEACRICKFCEYFDKDPKKPTPFTFMSEGGDDYECYACLAVENRLVEEDTSCCKDFLPNAEAEAEAQDEENYRRDPYAYNGVSRRDFF